MFRMASPCGSVRGNAGRVDARAGRVHVGDGHLEQLFAYRWSGQVNGRIGPNAFSDIAASALRIQQYQYWYRGVESRLGSLTTCGQLAWLLTT